jgi:hypothetical protein
MTPSVVSTDWVESLATANPSPTSYTPVKRPRANDSSESGRDYATMSQRELIDMVKGLQEQNLILTRLLDRATALQSFKPNLIATRAPAKIDFGGQLARAISAPPAPKPTSTPTGSSASKWATVAASPPKQSTNKAKAPDRLTIEMGPIVKLR